MTDDPRVVHGDLRRHCRIPVKLWADLYWEGTDRQMQFARAQVLDISEGGVRLRLPGQHLRVGLSVNVRIDRFGFSEFGDVRYAMWHGILGIELRFETAAVKQVDRWKRIVQSAQES